MITREEAAAMLSISPKTIDQIIRKKELPAVKLTRKCVRIPLKDLLKLIKEKTV